MQQQHRALYNFISSFISRHVKIYRLMNCRGVDKTRQSTGVLLISTCELGVGQEYISTGVHESVSVSVSW